MTQAIWQFTLHSKKYPGISIPVPHLPGNLEKAGAFTFYRDISYEITQEDREVIESLFKTYPERVSKHYRLVFRPVSTAAPASSGPETLQPKAPQAEVSQPEAPQPEAEPIVLSDEDKELIEIEISKLRDKTIAEATPIMENAAINEQLPKMLRVGYLEAIIADETLQKGLRDNAGDALRAITE